MIRIFIYILLFIFSNFSVSYGQKNIEDELFPSAKTDTIYKIFRQGNSYGEWFVVPFGQQGKDRYYTDTILVKECGYYTMWKGLYQDGSLHFISILKNPETFKERKSIKNQDDIITVSTDDDNPRYQYYFREMFRNGKLCAETYYDKNYKVKSQVVYNKDGQILSRKLSNRNYFEGFYDNGNRKSYSIPELLYINWYETGHVSSLIINELETVRFYSDGTLAYYERRGIPNVQYSWDALGEPARLFYYANFYPQWEAPLERKKIDSVKSSINKQNWMTGMPDKFNPESFKLNHFENGAIKIAAKFSNTPAANSINVYDASGQLFKFIADTANRRSQTSIDYWNKYNATYASLLSNPKLDSIWKVYGYHSEKLNQPDNLIEILLNKAQQYIKLQVKEHAYTVVDEQYNTEIHPLKYLSIYETNAPEIDTATFNAVLKEKPYPSDNKLFLENLIKKFKHHTALVIHRNAEECYECEYDYPPPAKTYGFSELSYNTDHLNYRLQDLSIQPITLLGDHLVVEYAYNYTINTDESKTPLSMREFYLLDLKTNTIASPSSIIAPARKKDFEIFLLQKMKQLNLDSLQQNSILKEITLLPRVQSFDLLLPADYHICNDDHIMYEDAYINIELNEIKPFLDPKHSLVQWMFAFPKEQASVQNRNQDLFEKEDLADFISNGISSQLFKNVDADTITISDKIRLMNQYVFNKNRKLIYKESTNEYREKTYFHYAANGKFNRVNKIFTKYDYEPPAISNTDWYFDSNGNLKMVIDSSSQYACDTQAIITHYYNLPNYTYIDKRNENEKKFYKDGLFIGSLSGSMQQNYIHDTTFIKKIVTPNSTSILIEGYYYTYDKSGNLIKMQDQMGSSVYEFQYSTEGQLQYYIHTKRSDEMNYFVDKKINYQYDSNKKLKSILIKYQSEWNQYEELYNVHYQ